MKELYLRGSDLVLLYNALLKRGLVELDIIYPFLDLHLFKLLMNSIELLGNDGHEIAAVLPGNADANAPGIVAFDHFGSPAITNQHYPATPYQIVPANIPVHSNDKL